jgi:hypothetical protein
MHIVTDEKGYPFSGLLLCIIQLFYFTFFRFSTLHLWDCRSPASSTDEGLTFFRAYRAEEKINYDLFNLLRVEPWVIKPWVIIVEPWISLSVFPRLSTAPSLTLTSGGVI